MLFQNVQQRYTCLINTIYFLVLLLTNHETPYNLKNIVLSFHPPFEPIIALYTITSLWPKIEARLSISSAWYISWLLVFFSFSFLFYALLYWIGTFSYDNTFQINNNKLCHYMRFGTHLICANTSFKWGSGWRGVWYPLFIKHLAYYSSHYNFW